MRFLLSCDLLPSGLEGQDGQHAALALQAHFLDMRQFAAAALAILASACSGGSGGDGGSTPPSVAPQFATLDWTSPVSGESSVAITRETVIAFSEPVDPETVTDASIRVSFGGSPILGNIVTSPDGLRASVFYSSPHLPANASVRVTVDGDQLATQSGRALDLDGDGIPGGATVIDFTTVTLTTIPNTEISGCVMASELSDLGMNVPLEGATIRVDGDPTLTAVTDSMGSFLLSPAPAGTFFVHIDGSTAINTPPGFYYPNVGKAWTSKAALRTDVGVIFLPAISSTALTPTSMSSSTTVTMSPEQLAEVDDPALASALGSVEVTVPPGSLFSDDGTVGGSVGVAPVAPDRLPGTLPPGLEFPLVVTVQTDGPTNFAEPAPIVFPNLPNPVTGVTPAAGEELALWSFDHDKGRFEVVGAARVSSDGLRVEMEEGVGIRAPGWHGVSPGAQVVIAPPAGTQAPCPSSLDGLAWDILLDALACAKQLGRLGELAAQIGDLAAVADEFAQGYAQLNSGVQNGDDCQVIEGVFSNVKGAWGTFKITLDTLKDQNPVAKGLAAVECASALADTVTGSVCQNADCVGGTKKKVCDFIVPAVEKTAVLVGKISQTDSLLTQALAGGDTALATVEALVLAKCEQKQQGLSALPVASGMPTIDEQLADAVAELAGYAEEVVSIASALEELNQARFEAEAANDEFLAEGASPFAIAQRVMSLGYWKLSLAGVEQRGRLNADGFASLALAAETVYSIEVYLPQIDAVAIATGFTPANGQLGTFGPFEFELVDPEADEYLDSDLDGLGDVVEAIIGTGVTNPDTDGDGLLDGAELELGLDPLDGILAPTGIVGTLPLPGYAQEVVAFESALAVACGSAGVALVNVASPATPLQVAQVPIDGDAIDLALHELTLVVAAGPDGISFVDITDPVEPEVDDVDSPGGSVTSLEASGGVTYAGTSSGALHSYHIPTRTRFDTTFTSVGAVVDMVALQGILYVAGSSSVEVFDLANGRPSSLGVYASPHRGIACKQIATDGKYLFVTHGLGFNAFSLTNPESPVLLFDGEAGDRGWRSVVPDGAGFLVGMRGANVGISSDDQVAMYSLESIGGGFDIDGSFVGEFQTPGQATSAAFSRGILFVADGEGGLQVVNLTSADVAGLPPSPQWIVAPQAAIEQGAAVSALVSATDDVRVAAVEFFLDDQPVYVDVAAPYELDVQTMAAVGEGALVGAQAIDTGGARSSMLESTVTTLADGAAPVLLGSSIPAGGLVDFGVDFGGLEFFFSEAIDPLSAALGIRMLALGPNLDLGPESAVVVQGAAVVGDGSVALMPLLKDAIDPGWYGVVIDEQLLDLAGNSHEGSVLVGLEVAGPDSDGDGLYDAFELEVAGTDPLSVDSDGDGLSDFEELVDYGTNPLQVDSDGDGVGDGSEVLIGTDPSSLDPVTFIVGTVDLQGVDPGHTVLARVQGQPDGLYDGVVDASGQYAISGAWPAAASPVVVLIDAVDSSGLQRVGISSPTETAPGGVTVVPTIDLQTTIDGMVPILPGVFMMGSDLGAANEQPVHEVTISSTFWMGRYEVTQFEYESLMGENPSIYVGADRPVDKLSWFSAMEYCEALSVQQGALGNLPEGYEYRLPTEAEWEYACRAGTAGDFGVGDGDVLLCSDARIASSVGGGGWCDNPSGSADVGSFEPNAWGLYDMHGNVWEWCLDSFAFYGPGPVEDPFVSGGAQRHFRGGSWLHNSTWARSAYRSNALPAGNTYSDAGFRVVLAPVLVP